MVGVDTDFYGMKKPVMACGHVSNALYTTEEGEKIPICSLCYKITPELAKEVVDLKGRFATCHVCGNKAFSSPDLFDFHYSENGDTFYDWCLEP